MQKGITKTDRRHFLIYIYVSKVLAFIKETLSKNRVLVISVSVIFYIFLHARYILHSVIIEFLYSAHS